MNEVVSVFSSKCFGYVRLCVFLALVLSLAGLPFAATSINLVSPEDGFVTSDLTPIAHINFTSDEIAVMNDCYFWYFNTSDMSSMGGTHFSDVDNNTDLEDSYWSSPGPSNYTWYAECSNVTENFTSVENRTFVAGAPYVIDAVMYSNNTHNSSLATLGDAIYVNITFSENVTPSTSAVQICGYNPDTITPGADNTNWLATSTTPCDSDGEVSILIFGYPSDATGLIGVEEDTVDTPVIFDGTAPSCDISSLTGTDYYSYLYDETTIYINTNYGGTINVTVDADDGTGTGVMYVSFQNLSESGILGGGIYNSTYETTYAWNNTSFYSDDVTITCTDMAGNENTDTFSLQSEYDSPVILDSFINEPDNFYSAYDNGDGLQNHIATINVSIQDAVSGTELVEAEVRAFTGNESQGLLLGIMRFTNEGDYWVGQIDLAELISEQNFSQESPVVPVMVYIQPYSNVHNTIIPSESSIYTFLLEDLGAFQEAPGALAVCFQEGDESTNLSQVLDFNDVNLVIDGQMNGSQSCANSFVGINRTLPWGNEFKTVAVFNFSSVNLSSQEQAAAVMGAIGNLITFGIAPPYSFNPSRIFVNTTNLTALNGTLTTVSLYDLPFTSAPNITYDGGAADVEFDWVQGDYDSSYGSMIGNLTITVSTFSGYNFTDLVPPVIGFISPLNNSEGDNRSLVMNVSINGTGTPVSSAYFYVNNSLVAAFNRTSNGTVSTNTAHCANITNGSEMYVCTFSYNASSDGLRAFKVSARDYGNRSGNLMNSTVNFVIDTTAPTISIGSPANNSHISDHNTSFVFTATELLSDTLLCDLTLDGELNYEGIEAENGSATTIYANISDDLSDGMHNWSISCYDGLDNTATSSTYRFYLANATAGNGSNIRATGNLTNLSAKIDGDSNQSNWGDFAGSVAEVNITNNGSLVLSFDFNFDYTLNFSNINITTGATGGAYYLVISGVNATGGQVGNKTVKMYNVTSSSTYNAVCVKDADGYTQLNISSTCTGTSEKKVPCNGTAVSGIRCTRSGSTLTITGLQHSAIKQYNIATTDTSGSSSTGGGSPGSSSNTSSSASYGNKVTSYDVDIGFGTTCKVTVTRDLKATATSTVITTKLENDGGSACKLTDYSFADTMPSSFPALSAVTISPTPSSTSGKTVTFSFPTFSSGESKVLTYTVGSKLSTAIVNNFTTYTMSAKKQTTAPAPETEPEAETGTGTNEPGTGGQGTQPPAKPPATVLTPIEEPKDSFGGVISIITTVVLVGAAILIVAGVGYYMFARKKHKGL